jgi:hypothetical protein
MDCMAFILPGTVVPLPAIIVKVHLGINGVLSKLVCQNLDSCPCLRIVSASVLAAVASGRGIECCSAVPLAEGIVRPHPSNHHPFLLTGS